MKKLLFLLSSILVINLTACDSNNPPPIENKDSITTLKVSSESVDSSSKNNKTYEYDALQSIFLSITLDTTPQDLEKMITDNNLYYSVAEYNQTESSGKEYSYIIAYSEGAAKHRYADPGSTLEVDFDNGNNNKLKNAYYSNTDAVGYGALFYVYGVWFDFRNENAEDYKGYYLIGDNDPRKANGITIKYANGREAETDYIKYDSSETLINQIIDYTNK